MTGIAMAATAEKLYRAHVQNLHAVDTALKALLRELNANLARDCKKTSEALQKTSMLLLGSWAENRLRKLVFEPSGFSEAERNSIVQESSQICTWKKALEVGFRRRYGIPSADLSVALDITPRSYFCTLSDVLEQDLRPIIEMRNKLAHGQWARTLNSQNTDFEPTLMAMMRGENAHTIKCKKRIMDHMAQLIHDLVAGNHAFERDFDAHFKKLEGAKRDMVNRSYDDWLQMMRDKHERGRRSGRS